MALAYSIIGNADQDSAFTTRVKAAIENAAISIENEASGTINHIMRLRLVGRVLSNPVVYSQKFAIAVASVAPVLNAVDLASAPDTDIQTGVNAV